MVAAEAREFEGILKRAGEARRLPWPGAAFSREIVSNNRRWLLIANGPGPRLVDHALQIKPSVDRVVSIGFCGALDPALRIGDIVVSGEVPEELGASFVQGDVLSLDRVAITAAEKGELRASTQAAVVEMESAAVARKAQGSPIAAGLIAFGAGLLVSSMLPASRAEQQAAQAVKDTAQPLVDDLTDTAKEIAGNLQEPAQQALEEVKATATDSTATVRDEAASAAADVKAKAAESKDTLQQAAR